MWCNTELSFFKKSPVEHFIEHNVLLWLQKLNEIHFYTFFSGMLDVTTDKSSSFNKTVYNTQNNTAKREPSVNDRSFLFSLIVVIAVLIIIFVIFLYTQLFES